MFSEGRDDYYKYLMIEFPRWSECWDGTVCGGYWGVVWAGDRGQGTFLAAED